MASNAQKTPFVRGINEFAEKKVLDAIQLLGRALPCHVTAVTGQIVTVAFDISDPSFTLPSVSMPISTSAYDWLPVQIGDKGYTAPADAYMGGVSGLGGGVASLATPANLSALIFTPVSNSNWSVPNANQRVVQGPDGALIRDQQNRASINLTPAAITCTIGDTTFVLTSSGITATTATFTMNGNLVVTGTIAASGDITAPDVVAGSISGKTHEHGGVTTGSGNTGAPI